MRGSVFRKLICTGLLIGALAITGCASGISGQTGKGNEAQTDVEQEPAQEAAQDMEIETKYGTLHYSDQWREFIKIQQSEQDDVVSVEFTAMIHDKEYPLFVVNIGGGEGSEVGKLTDSENKERTVYISASEIKEEADLNADEQNRLYAMQEDINYVVDHLQ